MIFSNYLKSIFSKPSLIDDVLHQISPPDTLFVADGTTEHLIASLHHQGGDTVVIPEIWTQRNSIDTLYTRMNYSHIVHWTICSLQMNLSIDIFNMFKEKGRTGII